MYRPQLSIFTAGRVNDRRAVSESRRCRPCFSLSSGRWCTCGGKEFPFRFHWLAIDPFIFRHLCWRSKILINAHRRRFSFEYFTFCCWSYRRKWRMFSIEKFQTKDRHTTPFVGHPFAFTFVISFIELPLVKVFVRTHTLLYEFIHLIFWINSSWHSFSLSVAVLPPFRRPFSEDSHEHPTRDQTVAD